MILTVATLLLSLLGIFLVFESAGQEPFLRVRTRDIFSQVVISVVAIVLLLEMAIIEVVSIIRKEMVKANLVLLLLSLFVLFWLVQVPATYISDVVKFQP